MVRIPIDCLRELSAHDACAQRPPAGASHALRAHPLLAHNACRRLINWKMYWFIARLKAFPKRISIKLRWGFQLCTFVQLAACT